MSWSRHDPHWIDPPEGETPHCPVCGRPQKWEEPILCDRCVYEWRDQYEPEDPPDPGGRCYR